MIRIDRIVNEVWKYGGKKTEEWIRRFCNKVCRGEGWPEEWKDGLIVPIRKKGNGEGTEDRGISIMPSLYKIYVSILTERLKEEIERKEIVPENQTGFRKGKGTLDNIYIINYLINRQISEKKGKMVVLFESGVRYSEQRSPN